MIGLATGKVEVCQPERLEKNEEASWNDLSERISKGDRTFRLVIDDNKGIRQKLGFPDWVRVSIAEVDDKTSKLLRTIPVQTFEGEHEGHGTRGLTLEDGHLHFFMQFWVND